MHRVTIIGIHHHRAQALDREEDYDEVDAIATDTYTQRLARDDLRQDLQVLDERNQQPSHRAPAKRVCVAPDTRKTNKTAPRSGDAGQVPDHVRNPHKYTVYPLDAPLVVGSGVVPDDVPAPDMVRVRGQTQPGAQPSADYHAEGAALEAPTRFEPVSGSGVIAFRASGQRGKGSGGDKAAKHSTSTTIAMQVEEEEEEEEAAMEVVPGTSTRFRGGQPKQRQLRKQHST